MHLLSVAVWPTLALMQQPLGAARPALRSQSAPRSAARLNYASVPAKAQLFDAINEFNAAAAADGLPKIDFGVKGGELDSESRAPRDLYQAGAYHAVSERVGTAADRVIAAVNNIAAANPTPEPTEGLGSSGGSSCPLDGPWSNIFTTAADAVFAPDSKRGGALVSNVVDGARGRITNCIDFLPRDHPAFRATRQVGTAPSPVESLRVRLSARAVSAVRVELVFRLVMVRLNRFFGLPLRFTLALPVPGPFITRSARSGGSSNTWLNAWLNARAAAQLSSSTAPHTSRQSTHSAPHEPTARCPRDAREMSSRGTQRS